MLVIYVSLSYSSNHFEAAFFYDKETGAMVVETVDLFARFGLSVEHVVFYVLSGSRWKYSSGSVRL